MTSLIFNNIISQKNQEVNKKVRLQLRAFHYTLKIKVEVTLQRHYITKKEKVKG